MSANLFIDTKEDKELLINNSQTYALKKSFMITYTLLLTTATITVIEALRNQNPSVRHVLNLETAISLIAGYFYSLFIVQVENIPKKKDFKKDEDYIDNQKLFWSNITQTRYIDWAITTPLMLITLCLVLSINTKKIIYLKTIASIIFLNYIMLYIGYLGETNYLEKISSMIISFIAFFLMYFIIYYNYVRPKYFIENYVLFFIYLLVWTLYGVVYLFEDELKNTITNYLDLSSKCLVGIGLWIYYTKIIQ